MNERRSFSQYGGEITTAGDPEIAAQLVGAWRSTTRRSPPKPTVERGESEPDQGNDDVRDLTHGFHAYPARLHPRLAGALIEQFSRPGEFVVDPFCGSGTVLVEALAAQRHAFGSDVNALAIRLAHQKSRVTAPAWRARFLAAADRVARRGFEAARQEDDLGPPPPEVASWFLPHVWRELDALGQTVDRVADRVLHETLLLVLSSLLTKVSRRESETSERVRWKPITAGFTSHLFIERARELERGLAALAKAAGRGVAAEVALADARRLPLADGSAALIVTSPPYFGTYDYAAIQTLRAQLIGLDLGVAQRHELGRRGAANRDGPAALAEFTDGMADALREMARVLRPDGFAVVVTGDSHAGGRSIDGLAWLGEAAARAGLAIAASATQMRPLPAAREHLAALRVSSRGP